METKVQNILFIIFLVLFFGAFIIFGIWLMRWQFNRADILIENWAKENKYQIIEKQNANFGDGPAGRRQETAQVKYRVVITDQNGQRKGGLVKVGSKNMGTLSDEITVIWDE